MICNEEDTDGRARVTTDEEVQGSGCILYGYSGWLIKCVRWNNVLTLFFNIQSDSSDLSLSTATDAASIRE